MSLKEEDRQALVTLQIEKAERMYSEVALLFKNEMWGITANRLYYALFHAVSAMLLSDKHEVGTHRGVVSMFSLYYVKTGLFSQADGRLYSHLQKLREDDDYNCVIDVDKTDVEEKILPVKNLIEKIKQYIESKQ